MRTLDFTNPPFAADTGPISQPFNALVVDARQPVTCPRGSPSYPTGRARGERLRPVKALQSHPWWDGVNNRHLAQLALYAAAKDNGVSAHNPQPPA
ncbi:hypothetical protein GCM10010412_100280 [Nonomuraea recticatena]|uniref:Uncharacterized protein n=1 Tax=Nonomuraea recticatena TaxID=46178 RepID=A0ABP6FW34_9ACTN